MAEKLTKRAVDRVKRHIGRYVMGHKDNERKASRGGGGSDSRNRKIELIYFERR